MYIKKLESDKMIRTLKDCKSALHLAIALFDVCEQEHVRIFRRLREENIGA